MGEGFALSHKHTQREVEREKEVERDKQTHTPPHTHRHPLTQTYTPTQAQSITKENTNVAVSRTCQQTLVPQPPWPFRP